MNDPSVPPEFQQYKRSRKGKLAWAFEELNVYHHSDSDQPAEDFTSVYLEDPSIVASIESQLRDLISVTKECLEHSGYRFAFGLEPQIEKEYGLKASRSATFAFEDIKKPQEIGTLPEAYSRFKIMLSSRGCMLRNHSCIIFPVSVAFDLLKLVMLNTSESGIPSEMNIQEDRNGQECISITFQSGYGLSSAAEDLPREVLHRVHQHMEFLSIASKASLNPSGVPGVHGVIEAVNLISYQDRL